MSSLWLTVVALAATQAESDANTMHRSPHTVESEWVLGAKAVQLSEFPDEGEALFGGGIGVFVERTVLDGWMEVELSGSLVRVDGEEWVIPLDLLLKKPFHFGLFCPYIAVGPTVAFVRAEDETEAFFGAAAVLGAYIWFSESVGVDIEVDYAILAENGVQHELTFAAGPTLRF